MTFGAPGTAAIDTATGKVLWERRDLECNHYRGAGSSPVIFRDLLLLHYDGSDLQYVVALDKRTGKTVWKTPRSIDFKDLGPDGKPEAEGDMRKAFATPQIITVDGAPLLISMGAKATYAYDPLTGKERWRVEERTNHSASTRPVSGFGLVFLPTGFPKGELLAVRPDGRGDITATHVAWRLTRGVPNKPSVLLVDDLLFMTTDAGVASAVEARTGAVVWTGRIGGTHSASPVAADGRVYFFSEDGKTIVVEAGRTFKVLAENSSATASWPRPRLPARRSSCDRARICIASNRDDSTSRPPAGEAGAPAPTAAEGCALASVPRCLRSGAPASRALSPNRPACRCSTGRT